MLEMLLGSRLSGPIQTKVIVTGPMRPLVVTTLVGPNLLQDYIRIKFVLTPFAYKTKFS